MQANVIQLYIILTLLEVLVISFVMEVYKKVVRKDAAKSWECWLVGMALSAGCVVLQITSGSMYPLFHNVLGSEIWLDHLAYLAVFYIAQMKVDMVIVKKVVKSLVSKWVETNLNISMSELEKLAEKKSE